MATTIATRMRHTRPNVFSCVDTSLTVCTPPPGKVAALRRGMKLTTGPLSSSCRASSSQDTAVYCEAAGVRLNSCWSGPTGLALAKCCCASADQPLGATGSGGGVCHCVWRAWCSCTRSLAAAGGLL